MRIALFTNSIGLQQFENSALKNKVKTVIRAYNRTENIDQMEDFCHRNKIEIISQPAFNSPEYLTFLKQIHELNSTHIISNQYSLIIRPDMLKIAPGRAINIHWSKLPKNRGPNPIQWSIIRGESETGVTVHLLTDTIDEGPILYQETVSIEEHDSWVTLMEKLQKLSTKIIETKLETILTNIANFEIQNEELATTNFRLNPTFPEIDFTKMTNRYVFNLIRAQISPLVGAYLVLNNETIRFNKVLTIKEVELVRQKLVEGDVTSIKKIATLNFD